MAKGGKQQTVTQSGNPGAQQAVWNAAYNAGTGGMPQGAQTADNFYTGAAGAGQMGLNALQGNPGAVHGLLNPFMQNVIDATQADFAHQNAMTANQIGDMATKANAFGGSRYGVALGTALADNQRNQGQELANLRYGGYNDAMNRAGQLAGFGFGGAQGASGLINYTDPNYRALSAMGQGLQYMPQTQTTTGNNGKNVASGLLGGAATGAQIGSLIPGIGTGIGALAGGLLGGFF